MQFLACRRVRDNEGAARRVRKDRANDIIQGPARQIALTLRRILLLAFVLLGLVPSAALSWLSFARTREAMTREIQQNLAIQARAIQSDIDQMLFERFENAVVWRRSELMEDLRLGDVDKRVSNYLVGLREGYGDVYDGLDCVDAGNRIVASSAAARIGTIASAHDDALVSVVADAPGGAATLFLARAETLAERDALTIDAPIPSSYSAAAAGRMRLRMTLAVAPIDRLLDAAAQDGRVIVVVDRLGRWVAGSSRLRGQRLPGLRAQEETLLLAHDSDAGIARSSPWMKEAALTGRAVAMPKGAFGSSGWTTMIFEPVDEALAPVSRLGVVFIGLFTIVLLATLAAAVWVAAAMSRPIAWLTERTRRHQQGLAASGSTMRSSAITEVRLLASAYDDMIRSLESSRGELVRASKMAMLGELGAVLAHEVRTPLGILRSSAQVLMRNPGLGPEGMELMRFIETETERLNRLVSTLLDTARPPRLEPMSFDLNELIAECVQMHALKQAAELGRQPPVTLELRATAAQVLADPEQLKQVIFNLLANACEAAGPHGHVAVSTSDAPDAIRIDCEDSGPGVAPELENVIFEPFVSRRAGGFGLGLAVVRQIVAAHDGTIHVGSSRWTGARFTICLPRGMRMPGAIQ